MSLDVLILILRTTTPITLYAFLLALLLFIWRDIQLAGSQAREGQRAAGRLVLTECGDLALEVGRQYPLLPITTLGRGPTNTIVLPESFASIEHARITLRKGQWWLEDRRSRNGTLLNGVPVSGSVVLSSGDVIGIGRVSLRFESQ
jgi:hypothetical protein